MSAIDFEQTRRFSYADGRSFGEAGSYEQIDGILTFAVDPLHETNSLIVDLEKAPRDADGRVRFRADFSVIAPVDPAKRSRNLLVELPNRGRRGVVNAINMAGAGVSASPPPGDGFLFNHGFTVVSIGWQWDVYRGDPMMGLEAPMADLSGEPDPGQTVVDIRPNELLSTRLLADRVHVPLRVADVEGKDATLYVKDYEVGPETEVSRSLWRFAKETPDGIVPSDEHIYLEGGFQPGKCYQVVYSTNDAPVVGAGLLAVRDVASAMRYEPDEVLPGLGGFDHVFGYGSSQTGRMLRHFLYLGLNVDEQGRKVFDGLLPHVSGGKRGKYNHRYAQPSSHNYPAFGHRFPFADDDMDDPLTGERDGLMARLRGAAFQPKVIYTNTSAEYWRGDCALVHMDPQCTVDIKGDPLSRIYHFAGTQHGAGALPQTREGASDGAVGLYDYNVVDHSPLLRAAFINLVRWVADGVEPPPSDHPKIGDSTAADRGTVLRLFDRFPDQVTPAMSRLFALRTVEPGPRASEGVGRYPSVEGPAYPCLVSAVDVGGNEIGGIKLPDITTPVATHTGWNPRAPETGSPDQQVPMQGFSKWFAVTREEREAANDPRLSIEERYPDRDSYLAAAREDTARLVSAGYVLAEDEELVTQSAVERYDYVVSEKKEAEAGSTVALIDG